jgi:hypothetical protein
MLIKDGYEEDEKYFLKPLNPNQYKFYKKYFFDLPDVMALKENQVVLRLFDGTLTDDAPTHVLYSALVYGLELIKKVPLKITKSHVLVHKGDKIGFCGSETSSDPVKQLVETVCHRNLSSEVTSMDQMMGDIIDLVKKKVSTEKIDAIDLLIFMKYLSKNIFLK